MGSYDLCVAVMQVYGVGDGDLRQMADFRSAWAVEMELWAAEEQA